MNQFCRGQTRLDKVRKLIKKEKKKKKEKEKRDRSKHATRRRGSAAWGYRRVRNRHLDYASPPTTGGARHDPEHIPRS
jgi:hypothetical protein